MSLKKFLYGLKQVSRLWFAKFSTSIEVAGFALSKADYSLFTYQRGKFFVALLILLRNFYSDFEIKIFGRFEVFAGC